MTRTPLERTLPALLEKSLAAGWRVLVRVPDRARAEWLDQKLWLVGGGESFLPHGLAGGPQDPAQPVLLTDRADNPTGADALICTDGAPVAPEEVAGYARVMLLFDGNDPQAVEAARSAWKALTGAGHHAQYWSQESGRWQKKAQS
ncbi:MAG TPA: DNA polymerase III subunit chi [Rhodobacteraceae bacterium]|nr:DNA polymerase III subunit chi [Paracoccaceae bacterium]